MNNFVNFLIAVANLKYVKQGENFGGASEKEICFLGSEVLVLDVFLNWNICKGASDGSLIYESYRNCSIQTTMIYVILYGE